MGPLTRERWWFRTCVSLTSLAELVPSRSIENNPKTEWLRDATARTLGPRASRHPHSKSGRHLAPPFVAIPMDMRPNRLQCSLRIPLEETSLSGMSEQSGDGTRSPLLVATSFPTMRDGAQDIAITMRRTPSHRAPHRECGQAAIPAARMASV